MSGDLLLQRCANCGRVHYPTREICDNCLSSYLPWQKTDGRGLVLSHTLLHASVEPRFQERLPIAVALVKLDAGPVLYAFADRTVETGARVEIKAEIDGDGARILRVGSE